MIVREEKLVVKEIVIENMERRTALFAIACPAINNIAAEKNAKNTGNKSELFGVFPGNLRFFFMAANGEMVIDKSRSSFPVQLLTAKTAFVD